MTISKCETPCSIMIARRNINDGGGRAIKSALDSEHRVIDAVRMFVAEDPGHRGPGKSHVGSFPIGPILGLTASGYVGTAQPLSVDGSACNQATDGDGTCAD